MNNIERTDNVRILFAIESGSRAWGFPSPDSDYDVRFVYVHDVDWYLSIDDRRDVIELPIEGDLDINGWDLCKALQLLIKPNPVLLEWLRSPIVYRANQAAMDKIATLGKRTTFQRPMTYHYLHLAESQYRRDVGSKETVSLKKYFYSLRPALALRWMRVKTGEPVPMDLATLQAGVDLPDDVVRFIEDLLARKANTRELGEGNRVDALDKLIEEEIELAKNGLGELPAPGADLIDEANTLFRELVLG